MKIFEWLKKLWTRKNKEPTKCSLCDKEVEDYFHIYKCAYCGRHFCIDHRLPENHECTGELKAPPGGGYRVLYRKGKTTIRR